MLVENTKGERYEVSEEHYNTYKRDLKPVTESVPDIKKKVVNARKVKAKAEVPA